MTDAYAQAPTPPARPLPNPKLAHEKQLRQLRQGRLDVLPMVVPYQRLASIYLAHPHARVVFADACRSELRQGVGSSTRAILGIVLPRPGAVADVVAPLRARVFGAPADEQGERGERRGWRRAGM